MPNFREINFGPLAHNVLDYIGREDLVTAGGQKVKIAREGGGFRITIGKTIYGAVGNLDASYCLNVNQVGVAV